MLPEKAKEIVKEYKKEWDAINDASMHEYMTTTTEEQRKADFNKWSHKDWEFNLSVSELIEKWADQLRYFKMMGDTLQEYLEKLKELENEK